MDGFVPLELVAEQAGVSLKTVRNWVQDEQITVFSIGSRRKRFMRRDDAEWLLAPKVVRRAEKPEPATVRG